MNKIEINIPKGYEIDNEKSNFSKGVIEFKPVEKKKLSYEDVAKKLFYNKETHFVNNSGRIVNFKLASESIYNPSCSTSKEQLECLMAYNKLRNVAVYLNKEWELNWSDSFQYKYFIVYKANCNLIDIEYASGWIRPDVYFASKKLALQAIEILGEKEIKKALFIY